MVHLKNVNSEYTYNSDRCKNCYLLANTVGNEDCMYGRDFYDNQDCVDCDHVLKCILCYECVNCKYCYNSDHCTDCENCTDCLYGYDLRGCRNCIGCAGLRNKEYCIFNEPYKPDKYRKEAKKLSDNKIQKGFEGTQLKSPRIYAVNTNAENFTGNYVHHCQNAYQCFDVVECQDVAYLDECKNVKDSYDVFVLEYGELCYEISSCHILNNCNFCFFCVSSTDCEYSEILFNCEHCFGCISLHHKKYHILNRPYEKEEYFQKVAELRKEPWYAKEHLSSTYAFGDTVAVWPVL